jgi:hypothetical protein
MKEWTGTQIETAAKGLEQAAAGILGRMLFEFARLDVALGFFLVWSDEGRQLEKLTKTVGDYSFHKKLDLLKDLVEVKYATELEVQSHYTKWLTDAHATKGRRNELVHGRWGTDPIQAQVVNVVGLPTSSDQREVRYSIPALKGALNEMKDLQKRLQVLRKQWPI